MSGRRVKDAIDFCAYCKFETKSSPTSLEEVQAHVKVCEFHPLAKANQRIKELEADRSMVTQKWIDLRERDRRLVAAIEAICCTVEKDYPFIRDIQLEALKEHKGEL